jgi:hypothetical protein
MNIIERIVAHNYVATDADVQQLAQQVVTGRTADATYLKVLVVATQSAKAKRNQSQLGHFELTADRLYQLVLAGVSAPDMPKTEINRRATFARTSASALRRWLKAGGDVKSLDPLTVTKRSLAPPRPVRTGDRFERSIQTHKGALLGAIEKMETRDRVRAVSALTELIDSLQAELDELEEEAPAQIVRVPHMERVQRSERTLHSRAAA